MLCRCSETILRQPNGKIFFLNLKYSSVKNENFISQFFCWRFFPDKWASNHVCWLSERSEKTKILFKASGCASGLFSET